MRDIGESDIGCALIVESPKEPIQAITASFVSKIQRFPEWIFDIDGKCRDTSLIAQQRSPTLIIKLVPQETYK